MSLPWLPRRDSDEIDEEIRTHIGLAEDEYRRRGLDAEAARNAARRDFGAVEPMKERRREMRPLYWLDTLVQDVRYGLRSLAHSPALTASAVGTLALGIGASLAVYSIVYAVLLRPAPYPDPDRVVWVTSTARAFPNQPEFSLLADFLEWRDEIRSFSAIAVYDFGERNVADDGGAFRVQTSRVTAQFLSVLGVQPILGRDFRRDEEEPGQPRSALIGYGLWSRLYGRDRSAVGGDIVIEGEPHTVVGVLPPDFVFPLAFDVEILIARQTDVARELQRGPMRFYHSIARLAPGAAIEDAVAELDVFRDRINDHAPQMREWDLVTTLRPLHAQLVREVRPTLWILLAAVACLLLIACLNVGNLLLARASARRREMAVRGSVGAGRARLVRQLLTESALLSAAGGAAGVVVAVLVRFGLEAVRPTALFHVEIAPFNGSLLAFLLAVTATTVIVCGLAPALAASPTTPMAALKSSAVNASADAGKRRLLGALVVGQLALALVLLVGASLLVQSFRNMRFKSLGMRTDGVLAANILLDAKRYPDPERARVFFDDLLERTRAVPGVDGAALTIGTPPGGARPCEVVYAEGTERKTGLGDGPCVKHQPVTADYFSVLEIPLLHGTLFSDDATSSSNDAVVSAAFARTYFGVADPIGKRFRPPRGENEWRTVVGVVGDYRNHGLGANPEPHVYLPYHSEAGSSATMMAATSASMSALASAIGHIVVDIDPAQAQAHQPLSSIETMDDLLNRSVSRERFLTWVLTAFGASALLLAVIGVHGVVTYAVRQRRHEMAVRLALGAAPGDIARRVFASGGGMLALGLVAGLAGAAASTRLLSAFLFQTTATDWQSFAFAAAVLAAAALAACCRPARAAGRTDPLATLRQE